MSKSGSLFNPGVFLELAEKGLTFLSLKLENAVDRKVGRPYRKDKLWDKINARDKARKKYNKALAKSQDIKLEKRTQKAMEISKHQHDKIAERLQELDDASNEASQDADMDRD